MRITKIKLEGLMLDLQKIQEIRIEDWSEYEPGKSSNGGNYIYGTTFKKEGSRWSRIDWSSCELLDNEYSKSSIGELIAFLAYSSEEVEISIF